MNPALTPSPTEQPQQSFESDEIKESTASKCNDDSNPQQGSNVNAARVEQEVDSDPNTANIITNTSTSKTEEGPKNRRSLLAIPPFKKDARKLFVGGLPSDVTDAEFRSFFEQFGELVDSIVMFDYETHRSRGFGFVSFKDPEVASRLLTLGRDPHDSNAKPTGRVQMRDKLIEIKAAEPKESSSRTNASNRKSNRSFKQSYATDKPLGYYYPATYPAGGPYEANAYYPNNYYYGGTVGNEAIMATAIPLYNGPGMAPGYVGAAGYYVPPPAYPVGLYSPEGVAPPPPPPGAPINMQTPVEPVPAFVPMPVYPQPTFYVPATVMQPETPGLPHKAEDGESPPVEN